MRKLACAQRNVASAEPSALDLLTKEEARWIAGHRPEGRFPPPSSVVELDACFVVRSQFAYVSAYGK
jgi:hypothetical protein